MIILSVEHPLTSRELSVRDKDQVQNFLQLFDDFFLLCEGKLGSAQSLMDARPEGVLPTSKFVLGIYQGNELLVLIDLIKDYPEENVWTVGYLLVKPLFRRSGLGSRVVRSLVETLHSQGITKLRCVVQSINHSALKFWKKNNFVCTGEKVSKNGNEASSDFIFEFTL